MVKQEWFNKNISNKISVPNPTNDHCLNIANIYNSKCYFTKRSPISNNIFDILRKNKDIKKNEEKNIQKNIQKQNTKIQEIEKNDKLTEKKKQTKIKTLETKTKKKNENLNTVMKAKHVVFYPNNFQKEVFFKWNRECRKVYNETLKYYYDCLHKENIDIGDKFNYTDIKLIIFDRLFKGFKKSAPYDMLTDEIRIFFSNLKSAKTNLRNKNIKKYKLKPKNKNNKNFSLFIPTSSINSEGIYPNYKPYNDSRKLGKLKHITEDLKNIDIKMDCRLNYNAKLNEFSLTIPFRKNINDINDREKIVALDPGEKIFQAFYGTSSYGYLGENIKDPILKKEANIRRIQRGLANNKNNKGKKLKNKRKLLQKLRNNYNDIRNIVNELHHKSANYLCNNYDRILIPEFNTKNMLKNKKNIKRKIIKGKNKKIENLEEINTNYVGEERKEKIKEYRNKGQLNKRVKFVLNMLSHYRFRQHLSHKILFI